MTSKNMIRIASALLCLQSWLFGATAAGDDRNQAEFPRLQAQINATVIHKSINDDRSYAALMLDNHLQAVLVSDPALENSAASLAVNAGSAQDPESQPGLAHYLEHMLFLGTGRYPEPDGFSKFVGEKGGDTNATTLFDKTVFYFTVNADSFDGALDRFSDYFKSPTFDPVYSDKERNAVNNEWSIDKRNDDWNLQRIEGLTINPQNPFAKFDIGNLQTLADKPGSVLHDQLVQFYQQHYSANLMRLVLVGRQSIPELKQLAIKYFSTIANRNLPRLQVQVPAFTAKEYAKNIYYRPFHNIKELIVEFPVHSNKDQWMFKPNEYLANLINSEEPGSLCEQLRTRGYASKVTSESATDQYGSDGFFRVVIELTDVGVLHQDEAVAAVLAYVDLIRTQGLDADRFKQLQAIAEKKFASYAKPDPEDLAVDLSLQQFDVPLQHLLDSPTTYQEYKPELIKALFDQLDSHHVRIWRIDQHEKAGLPVSYFDGRYGVQPISDAEFAHLDELAARQHFRLPPLNNLFSRDSAPIVQNKFIKPHRVISETGIEAFLVQPQFYREDKGIISIELNSSLPVASARNAVLQFMMNDTLRKRNITLQDRARAAGLDLDIFISPSGSTGITVSGYTPKHAMLLSDVLQSFTRLDITLRDFQETQASLIDIIRNKKADSLRNQAHEQLDKLTTRQHWDDAVLIRAAQKSTLKELRSYQEAFKKSLLLRMFAAGNYTEDQVREMAHAAAGMLSAAVDPAHRTIKQFNLPKQGQHWNHGESVQLADDAVLLALFRDAKSDDERAQLAVLNAKLDGDLFTQLRTEAQIGYLVGSNVHPVDEVPGLYIIVQSSNTPVQKIVDRVNEFIKHELIALQDTSPQQIEQIKQSLLDNELQKPTDFAEEMNRYTNEFWLARYTFDARDRYIAALKKVTKNDVLNIYHKLLLDPNTGSLLIQYKGTTFKKQPFVKGGKVVS